MIPIEKLIRTISSDELFDLALTGLERINIPARSWRPGGVAKSILGVLAEVGAQGAAVLQSCIAGGFLLFGKGDYLTAHAKDVYDVDRIGATFATGPVTLTNGGGAIFTVGANELIVSSSNTSARFRVTDSFVLSALGTVTVNVSAIEPGSASSVAPTEIDQLETTLARVTVANAAAIVGRDEESDEQLVKRCIAKKGTWSPFGPRDAYEYAALSATLAGGIPTSITRVAVSRFSSVHHVDIVCATPSGTPSDEELDAVRAEVELIARPDTVSVTVSGAVTTPTAHTLILWARRGTEAVLRGNAQKAMATLIANWPIGGIAKTEGGTGYLYASAIEATVIGSSPENFDVDFVGGEIDIPLAANAVPTNTTTFDVRILQ